MTPKKPPPQILLTMEQTKELREARRMLKTLGKPTGRDDGDCANCGESVVVGDGLEWNDGDWCWACWQVFGTLVAPSISRAARTTPAQPAPTRERRKR